MTDTYRAMCAELTDAELANAARKALGEPNYATELHYFLSEDSNEYEPLMLAIRAAIAADRARRPKPPSLKEEALALIDSNIPYLDDAAMGTIRRALEALND